VKYKVIVKFTDHLSYYIYQPLAFLLLNIIKKSNITPNQVTFFALLTGFFSAIFILTNYKILAFLDKVSKKIKV